MKYLHIKKLIVHLLPNRNEINYFFQGSQCSWSLFLYSCILRGILLTTGKKFINNFIPIGTVKNKSIMI